MTRVLLVSTYEQGHQPLGLAAPAAALRLLGHDVRCLDLAVEPPQPAHFHDADLIAISVPMHTAARLGLALARRVRAINPAATLAFYGLYASALHDRVIPDGLADAVIGGEYELGLANLAAAAEPRALVGVRSQVDGAGPVPLFPRQRYPVPDRGGLPALDRYARFDPGNGDLRLAGYVEASRGCAHTCTHCPLTPTYGGRLRLVQPDTVLADIDQLVALGAQHISFGDPDFLNAVSHAEAIVDAMHTRHPALSFDATIKVEHLIEHADVLPRLRDRGLAFITSAFESVDDVLLGILEKGHTADDMERALEIAAGERLVLRPTWLPFTPWTTRRDYLALLAFVQRHDLIDHVQPVQFGLRLLLPPGSPLIRLAGDQGYLAGFDADGLSHTWRHPDPAMDALQAEIATIAAEAAARCEHDTGFADARATFARIRAAASSAFGEPLPPHTPPAAPRAARQTVPGLTESWFC